MKRCSEEAAMAVQWEFDKEISAVAQAVSGRFLGLVFFSENSSEEEFPAVTNTIQGEICEF